MVRIVEQRCEPVVPVEADGGGVFRVSLDREDADGLRDEQRDAKRLQQQFPTESASVRTTIDRESAQSRHGHRVAGQSSRIGVLEVLTPDRGHGQREEAHDTILFERHVRSPDVLVLVLARVSFDERVERVSRELIERAARVLGVPLTAFAVQTLVERAEQVLTSETNRKLSARDWKRFTALIDSDAVPPGLERAVRKRKAGVEPHR